MRRESLRRRAIVAQNRLFFSILSDVVRLVAVGGDAMQSFIAVLANFGMASRRVAGPCARRLASYCELGLMRIQSAFKPVLSRPQRTTRTILYM